MVVAGITQRQLSASLDTQVVNLFLANIEGDGHAEKSAVGKTVVLNYAIKENVSLSPRLVL